MKLLYYVEIANFKRFSTKQRLELDNPSVFIGPNNAGKTSAIQALALWSLAVKTWFLARRDSQATQRTATAINRLSIVAVPVRDTRFFWHDARLRVGNQQVEFSIEVGVLHEQIVKPLRIVFRPHSTSELIYCDPADQCAADTALLEYASRLNVELLYPMSGIETQETLLPLGRVNVLMGQGQTAQVLRNLCWQVFQEDSTNWTRITELLKRLFQVELRQPSFNETLGSLDLSYGQTGVKEDLDIAMAGRGLQQLLLLFAYLHSHPNSVLLIDEPDAHLELLRQRQVYVLLRDLAIARRSQVILVTHSEVILEEAADTNLVLLLEGSAENLATPQNVRNTLRYYGTEHYVKARTAGHVIYVEGSTDTSMLRAFADHLQHPAAALLDGNPNVYYVQNVTPEPSIESDLLEAERGFGLLPKEHFHALKGLLPSLRGVAILDSDGRNRTPEQASGLQLLFWKRYELENYFVTPAVLIRFVREEFRELELFAPMVTSAEAILDELVCTQIFDGNRATYEEFKRLENGTRRLVWDAKTQALKLSAFAEAFFERFSAEQGFPILLRKGEFFRLVPLTQPSETDPEIRSKLDALAGLLAT